MPGFSQLLTNRQKASLATNPEGGQAPLGHSAVDVLRHDCKPIQWLINALLPAELCARCSGLHLISGCKQGPSDGHGGGECPAWGSRGLRPTQGRHVSDRLAVMMLGQLSTADGGNEILSVCLLTTRPVSTRAVTVRIMTTNSTSTTIDSAAPAVSVLCKGCRSVQPIDSFLCPVPCAGCYRIRQQCRTCLTKSTKHYHAHREDLRAARQMRERQSKRVTCVCGASILVSYREKHEQTKRHQSIIALLGHNNNNNNNNTALNQPTVAVTATPPTPSPARIIVDAADAAAALSDEEWYAIFDKNRLFPRDPDVTAALGMLGALPTNKHAEVSWNYAFAQRDLGPAAMEELGRYGRGGARTSRIIAA